MRQINPHARRLRHNSTHAERTTWFQLRDRRLNGFKFRRQWTIGTYVVDFCCIDRRIIVEIDGGQHDEARDAVRTEVLTTAGYRVIRFWNNEVLENIDGVLNSLVAALQDGELPHPYPLPRAGDGVL